MVVRGLNIICVFGRRSKLTTSNPEVGQLSRLFTGSKYVLQRRLPSAPGVFHIKGQREQVAGCFRGQQKVLGDLPVP